MRRKYTQPRSLKKEPVESPEPTELPNPVEKIENLEPDAIDTAPSVESVENSSDTKKIASDHCDEKEEDEFEVEKILEKRVINGKVKTC